MTTIVFNHHDDLIVWPDGDYCTREDYRRSPQDYSSKSDDFEVVAESTAQWVDFMLQNEEYVTCSNSSHL